MNLQDHIFCRIEWDAPPSAATPPRQRGRLLLPGQRSLEILIFALHDGWVGLPARCPHEGQDLSNCPLRDSQTLVCPAHGLAISVETAGFPLIAGEGGFWVQLGAAGWPVTHAQRRADAQTKTQLQAEIDQLRLANLKLQRQILSATHSMDALLTESEQQKSQLKTLAKNQQALARFIDRVLDTLADLLLVIDTEGRIRRVNRAVAQRLGCSEAALVDTPIDALLAPDERQKLADALPPLAWSPRSVLLETTRLHGQYHGEHRLLAADAEAVFWLQSVLLHTEQGKLEGAVVTATDISELKRRETRMRLGATVFESSREAIFITDLDGTIQEVNTAFCQITGYERGEVIGQSTRILKSNLHDRKFYGRMWQALLNQGHWKGEIWDRRKNGDVYPMLLTINAVHDQRGRLSHYVAVSADISYQKRTEQELERLAYYDTLTGLPNRLLFETRFESERIRALREGAKLAVLFIDLDHFKNINDTLGHWAGDALLKEIAVRIQDCLRKTDTIARLGGDEFTVILPNLESALQAAEIARKLLDTIAKPVRIQTRSVYVGASIGIAILPDDGDDFTTLTKHADAAMYVSKANGRGIFQYFEPRMNEPTYQRVAMEAELYEAMAREDFVLYYQPKAECASGRITGAEALIRWRHVDGGMVPPNLFIPIAEDTGLILPLGQWILATACRQAAHWAEKIPGFRIAVNLSPKQLLADNFIDALDAVLAETHTRPECIELEITERLVMHDINKAVGRLLRVRERGIHIAMDDFGTGYSSLAYLQKLPIHTLKIDHSFIRAYNDPADAEQAAMIKTIITLGQALNLKIVAEGVETAEQLALLQAYGCDEIQGYYLSPPVPAAEFERRLLGLHRWSVH